MTSSPSPYRVVETKQYRKDVKRIYKRGYLITKLDTTINLLATGQSLPERFNVHKLTGNYAGYEECHIEPDWLLIFRKEKDRLVLVLTRTGSHSDLFGL